MKNYRLSKKTNMQYYNSNRNIKLLMFLISLLCSLQLYAQERVITGQVLDGADQSPIPGVNVVVKGTTLGTVTDFDGNYKLVSDNPITELIFTYVGYKDLIKSVGTSGVINVSLEADLEQLEEVVVVGYGQMKKSDLTGSLVSVEGEALQNTVSTSMDQALAGRAAGVVVTQNSGQPGGGVSIKIRGSSSFGSNEPLYIIDGVPISGNAQGTSSGFGWAGGGDGQTAVNALSAINNNDIESIEVLKDASATAIYGSRAANGVILVTTKSGKSGKTNISYDAFFALQEVPKKLDVLNLRDFAEYNKEIDAEYNRDTDPYLMDPSILGEGTNWQDEIFRVAPMHSHNLSLTGGNDKTTFATSLSYLDQEGIIIGSGFQKLTGRVNLNHKATDWFKIGASVNYGNTTEQITLNDDIDGVISLSLRQRPDIPVKNIDGSWGGPRPEDGINFLNPVAQAQLRDMSLERMKLFGNVNAEVNLHKNLKFSTKLGYDFGITNNYGFDPTYEIGSVVNNVNKGRKQVDQSKYWILTNFLTYSKNFNDKFKLTAMLGQEAQESSWEGVMAFRSDFVSNDITEINAGDAETAQNSGYSGSHALASYFGRGHIDILDRYMLTATFRYDGSSNFDSGKKWGFFPSFAFAWKVKNENFMQSVSKISDLKLRVGYGEVGNQDTGGGYKYGVGLTNYATKWGIGLLPTNYANPNLQWETSRSYNIGVDLAMFENRLELITELYQKNTSDLLMQLPLPMYMGSQGFGSITSPYTNIGEISNKGVEVTLNTVNTTGALKWNTGITLTVNRNEIVKASGQYLDGKVQYDRDHITRSGEGQPVGLFYGYEVEGIFQDAADVQNHAQQSDKIDRYSGTWVGDLKFKDQNNDGVINEEDITYIGDPNPDFTFGINNTLSWKNFDLNLMLTGSVGGEIFNYTRMMTEEMKGGTNQSAAIKNRAILSSNDNSIEGVTLVNPDASLPRAALGDPNANNRISDRYIEDGTYLRIQNLSIGYNLPRRLTSRMHLTKLRVYVNFQNLYTFTNYSGYDPEIGNYNQNPLLPNVDNGNYPSPRIYTMGLNVNF
ncbi:TonB-dependent receptor [Flammeovirga sp. SJP92]|uniref:SusC/RagA family TonB-linked outer membrane protein n=1 Tax=Flammeovirga sp. SJP92 TaxID=1775430 RepID=UPI001561A4F2|nr:TonB-dependent receptor [Flammeovirga sp. SJP92]